MTSSVSARRYNSVVAAVLYYARRYNDVCSGGRYYRPPLEGVIAAVGNTTRRYKDLLYKAPLRGTLAHNAWRFLHDAVRLPPDSPRAPSSPAPICDRAPRPRARWPRPRPVLPSARAPWPRARHPVPEPVGRCADPPSSLSPSSSWPRRL